MKTKSELEEAARHGRFTRGAVFEMEEGAGLLMLIQFEAKSLMLIHLATGNRQNGDKYIMSPDAYVNIEQLRNSVKWSGGHTLRFLTYIHLDFDKYEDGLTVMDVGDI